MRVAFGLPVGPALGRNRIPYWGYGHVAVGDNLSMAFWSNVNEARLVQAGTLFVHMQFEDRDLLRVNVPLLKGVWSGWTSSPTTCDAEYKPSFSQGRVIFHKVYEIGKPLRFD